MEPVATNSDSQQPQTPEISSSPSNPQPIAEFAGRPDFPECVRGQFVDIGGYSGLVVDITANSLKVRSPEERTRSFNYHTLRKLYGPRVEIEPMPAFAPEPEEQKEPERNIITNPDFTEPLKPINEFTGRRDFPQCAFGQHVDVGGYQGVVVEIVNRSLKVRSIEETTRSYNADVLRKLFPGAPSA